MADKASEVVDKIVHRGRVLSSNGQKYISAKLGREFEDSGRGSVMIISASLGLLFGIGLAMFLSCDSLWDLGLYLAVLAVFHLWEFTHVAVYNPADLSSNSFLLNHSPEYVIAICMSFLEYFFEWSYLSFLKGNWFIFWPGAIMTIGGLAIRIVGMITCSHNFTHIVQDSKRDQHQLVTNGIYSKIRHPGYMGWFWYTVGTQFMLANPICFAGFFYVSYKFFEDRIEGEEKHLIEFFGSQYEEFRKKTPTFIPLIK